MRSSPSSPSSTSASRRQGSPGGTRGGGSRRNWSREQPGAGVVAASTSSAATGEGQASCRQRGRSGCGAGRGRTSAIQAHVVEGYLEGGAGDDGIELDGDGLGGLERHRRAEAVLAQGRPGDALLLPLGRE